MVDTSNKSVPEMAIDLLWQEGASWEGAGQIQGGASKQMKLGKATQVKQKSFEP